LSSKQDKLVALQELADLETGTLYTDKFAHETMLYGKALKFRVLAKKITRCKMCSGLNIRRFTEGCPGWGNLNAKIFFIGQSLHEPGMLSGLPFIKGSGYSIAAALRLSGLQWHDVFFSNVVHCHPENNRASTEKEKDNCREWLSQEIAIVHPTMLVAMGNDAKQYIQYLLPLMNDPHSYKPKIYKIRHPASFMYAAPEQRIDWIVKLSLKMDTVL